jgi:hypothetical protein
MDDSEIYYWYAAGFCFGRVRPADKLMTAPNSSAILAAALLLGVGDGGITDKEPRTLAKVREEANRIGAR